MVNYSFKRFRARKFVRRSRFRRSFRSSRRVRSRRIIRRNLARRPVRPEIKYIDYTVASALLPSLGNFTSNFTPASMQQGSDEYQRIGNQVKFRWMKSSLYLIGPSTSTGGTFIEPDDFVRIILWSPRVDYSLAYSHMTGIGQLQIPDYNTVTVFKDFNVHLTRANQPVLNSSGTLTGLNPNGSSQRKIIKFSIPFPRVVRFPPSSISGSTALDPEKDVIYITMYSNFGNGSTGTDPATVQYRWYTRVTYTDN